jgi:hypothetical protein
VHQCTPPRYEKATGPLADKWQEVGTRCDDEKTWQLPPQQGHVVCGPHNHQPESDCPTATTQPPPTHPPTHTLTQGPSFSPPSCTPTYALTRPHPHKDKRWTSCTAHPWHALPMTHQQLRDVYTARPRGEVQGHALQLVLAVYRLRSTRGGQQPHRCPRQPQLRSVMQVVAVLRATHVSHALSNQGGRSNRHDGNSQSALNGNVRAIV